MIRHGKRRRLRLRRGDPAWQRELDGRFRNPARRLRLGNGLAGRRTVLLRLRRGGRRRGRFRLWRRRVGLGSRRWGWLRWRWLRGRRIGRLRLRRWRGLRGWLRGRPWRFLRFWRRLLLIPHHFAFICFDHAFKTGVVMIAAVFTALVHVGIPPPYDKTRVHTIYM